LPRSYSRRRTIHLGRQRSSSKQPVAILKHPPPPPQLSSRLHVTTYPCVALLAYPGARTKVVACLQGRFTAAQLLAALRRAVEEHGVLLTAERLQQEERVGGRGTPPCSGVSCQQLTTAINTHPTTNQQPTTRHPPARTSPAP
jgi:hypothetical protein